MSPYEQAAAVHEAHPEVRPFPFYVDYFLRHGFVYSTPLFFVMGRAVPRRAEASQITDCVYYWEKPFCDCWFIHTMAGNIEEAMKVMPWPLPWIGFERNRAGGKELIFLPADSIKRLSSSTHEPEFPVISH